MDTNKLNEALRDMTFPEQSSLHVDNGLSPEIVRYAAAAGAIKILEAVQKSIPLYDLNQGLDPGNLPKPKSADWGMVKFRRYSTPGKWTMPDHIARMEQQIKDFKADPDNKKKYQVVPEFDPARHRAFALSVTVTD